MKKVKHKIIAYCVLCDEEGFDVRLIPYQSADPEEDYLCRRCFKTMSQASAQEIMRSQGGKYRDGDNPPKYGKQVYVMSDGVKLTDGRTVKAYIRVHKVSVKHIWRDI